MNEESPIRSIDLPDDAPLWRYMRLSSLLILLGGTAFIPSLETLQKDDPNEAFGCCKKTQRWFQNLGGEERAMLLDFATLQEKRFVDGSSKADLWAVFYNIWLREMAKRRCAWCWYHGNIESMAQWHIYARDGVAIRTSPRRIRRALNIYNVDYGVISEVAYEDEQSDASKLFLRPYFQKLRCYRHEQEVRVVFPREEIRTPGIHINVNGRELIDWIEISPMLPMREAMALRAILEQIFNSTLSPLDGSSRLLQVNVSMAKLRIPRSPLESIPDHRAVNVTAFGRMEMPFLLVDDILREYPGDDHTVIRDPEHTAG